MPGSFYPGGGYPGLYLLRRDTTAVGRRITLVASVSTYNLVASDDDTYAFAASRQSYALVATLDEIAGMTASRDTVFNLIASQ